ncbi:DNA-directed RNA polymerase subunit delta [Paenibacillus sp. FSL W8-1187]|uniref:Probable DNA-directed RNA polymerase subunit delta n=1 Tax=Paenibacillus pasadenensis TaxID=217090 RepID=A0A2N5N078_9BACL|nr:MULTISPECIES: DNA-directed RNA polymerase subunit delta [Paenibacillus]PLT43740.1 DNA-directed RNA polymerase delta subunit [Paenibacillus pasadenensis]QGG54359.1 DNA-directed RNA polymerase subunit delta [Paenibacillus sp. B01]
MSTNLSQKFDAERLREMPMVDLAFEVLKAANTPYYYRDLMKEIAKYRGLTEEEVNNVIAQVYTEINIDGRFACVGSNTWGLKRWYPVEKNEDPITNAKRPRIINDDDDLEDEEPFEAEEEDTYAESEEDFDLFDEDREFDESEEDDAEAVDETIDEDDAEAEESDDEDEEDFEDEDSDEEQGGK